MTMEIGMIQCNMLTKTDKNTGRLRCRSLPRQSGNLSSPASPPHFRPAPFPMREIYAQRQRSRYQSVAKREEEPLTSHLDRLPLLIHHLQSSP